MTEFEKIKLQATDAVALCHCMKHHPRIIHEAYPVGAGRKFSTATGTGRNDKKVVNIFSTARSANALGIRTINPFNRSTILSDFCGGSKAIISYMSVDNTGPINEYVLLNLLTNERFGIVNIIDLDQWDEGVFFQQSTVHDALNIKVQIYNSVFYHEKISAVRLDTKLYEQMWEELDECTDLLPRVRDVYANRNEHWGIIEWT